MFEVGTQLPLFIWPAELYDEVIRFDWASCDIDLADLFEDKYEECSDFFIDSCLYDGIQRPMALVIGRGGVMVGNGHHRLAVAVNHNLVLPVVFDHRSTFPDNYTESNEFPSSWSDETFYADQPF